MPTIFEHTKILLKFCPPLLTKTLNANVTVHNVIHFATAAAFKFAPILTLRRHTLPPPGHCCYQSVHVWSTTAQFAWLASSAPASRTSTQA